MRRSRLAVASILAVMYLTGSWVAAQRLTVLTHDSFALPEELAANFTAATGIEVVFLPAGDAGELVNRAILTKARPLADLLYGIDDSLLERARNEDIFESYVSAELARVPPELHLGDLVTPVDVGYVVPNVDLAWFAANEVAVPASLEELADPRYVGLTAVQNPASSSPGLAFLLATVARFGDAAAGVAGSAEHSGFTDWLDFWAAMRANDVLVTDGWTDAYYTAFTRYGGDRPVVVSYLTSPAAEVIFSETELSTPPTANLACEGCAYRQVEAIGILRGTPNRQAAERFVDFMLSREVQEAIPLAMFVHPVVTDADVPQEFVSLAGPADAAAASLPSTVVQANQARWLAQWTAVVLQGRPPAAVR